MVDKKVEKVDSIESDTSFELESGSDTINDISYSAVVEHVKSRFTEAEDARRSVESRMGKAWMNFRGLPHQDQKFTKTEKSQAFVKLTKTKVVAGVGQVFDIVFTDSRVPIAVRPTPTPEGIPEKAHVDMQQLAPEGMAPQHTLDFGFEGDDNPPAPGATLADRIKEIVAPIYDNLPFIEGPARRGELEVKPAELAARQMDKEIQDQLIESGAIEEWTKAIYEAGLLGTGCIKGPFTEVREYPNWKTDEQGNRTYEPIQKPIPVCEQVSIWSIYPDPNAKNVQDAEYVIQRHRMNKFQLRQLSTQPGFREDAIESVLDMEMYEEKNTWEHTIEETSSDEEHRHVVYEYWGNIPTDIFGAEFEKELPEDLQAQKTIQVNIWVCKDQILRMAINPFLPKRIPYQIFHWEKDLYSFFGVGVAENMEDSQMLTNGFWRLAIDNAALAGNLVFEADEMNLVPGQDMTVYPGKIFRRRAGAPGQALFSHKFNSTAAGNIQIMEKAMQLADTSTGIPAVSHGQPAGTVGRTAMGMSMMMGAAGLNIKTVIRNIDQDGFKPLGEAYFAWNMQFSDKEFLKGDLSIVAEGTDNLLQKEVKSQRLLQFLQVSTSNPMTAPIVNTEHIMQEIAKTLDLDPEEVINSPKKQKAMAAMFAAMNSGGGSNGTNVATGETGPMSAQDNTGGGGGQAGVGVPQAPDPASQQQ